MRNRLFEQPLPEAGALGSSVALRWLQPDAWHWLAPAMAVFVLGVFVFGQNRGGLPFHPEPSPHLMATAAAAEPDMSYYVAVHHSENNTLRGTFEWTNGSHSLRTAPPMAQTNSVIQ